MAASAEARSLLDDLLREQGDLSAVERFAQRHGRGAVPAQARYYQDLIPTGPPGRGEQYAFSVDLDLCSGCKACVSACHSLNGLDEDETWRDIGLLHGGTTAEPWQQTVTTACHHCVEPACLEGCPVRAYEKDAATGIVRHLDDQCIGCQYCVLKCPYDVPKYSVARGVVRKCDMCHGRLSAGEAPACVQACPSEAITIRIVQQATLVAAITPRDRVLPGAFPSDYTKPTTAYHTRRGLPKNSQPGDASALRLEPAHWPLVWMLLLTQFAGGLHLAAAALAAAGGDAFAAVKAPLAFAALALLSIGLGASVLHLGRPLGAWRAFLGLRTSWMSREILAFGLFAGSAALFAVSAGWEWIVGWLPVLRAWPDLGQWAGMLAVASAASGLLGIYCSAMIYVDTRRAFWCRRNVFIKFFGATLLLGVAGAAAILAGTALVSGSSAVTAAGRVFAAAALVVRAALFAWELNDLRARRDPAHPNHRSMRVTWELCRPLVLAQWALFGFATIAGLLALTLAGLPAALAAGASLLGTFGAQLIERYFFFVAVIAPRMPGPIAPQPSARS